MLPIKLPPVLKVAFCVLLFASLTFGCVPSASTPRARITTWSLRTPTPPPLRLRFSLRSQPMRPFRLQLNPHLDSCSNGHRDVHAFVAYGYAHVCSGDSHALADIRAGKYTDTIYILCQPEIRSAQPSCRRNDPIYKHDRSNFVEHCSGGRA